MQGTVTTLMVLIGYCYLLGITVDVFCGWFNDRYDKRN